MVLPTQEVELHFEEPTSVAEARSLLIDLKQRVAELQASLGSINMEKPPRSQTRNYQDWADRRGRRISAHRKAVSHLRFVKAWLNNAEQNAFSGEVDRPSRQIRSAVHCVERLERLYLAVGDYLDTDSDGSYAVMEKAYNALATELVGMTTEGHGSSDHE